MKHWLSKILPEWLKWTGPVTVMTLLFVGILATIDWPPDDPFVLPLGWWFWLGGLGLAGLFLFLGRDRSNFRESALFTVGLGILLMTIFLNLWDKVILNFYHLLQLSWIEFWVIPGIFVVTFYLLLSIPALWRLNILNRFLLWAIQGYLMIDSRGIAYERLRHWGYLITGDEPKISSRYAEVLSGWLLDHNHLLNKILSDLEIQVRAQSPQSSPADLSVVTTRIQKAEISSLFEKLSRYRQVLAFHVLPSYISTISSERGLTAILLWLENRADVNNSVRLRLQIQEKELRSIEQILQQCSRIQKSPSPTIQGYLIERLKKKVGQEGNPLVSNNTISSIDALLNMNSQEDVLSEVILRLSLQARLDELAGVGDYQALVQFCSRFLKTQHAQDEELTIMANRYMGLAWWDHANRFPVQGISPVPDDKKTLRQDPDTYILYACQKATQCWVAARWTRALEMLTVPENK